MLKDFEFDWKTGLQTGQKMTLKITFGWMVMLSQICTILLTAIIILVLAIQIWTGQERAKFPDEHSQPSTAFCWVMRLEGWPGLYSGERRFCELKLSPPRFDPIPNGANG